MDKDKIKIMSGVSSFELQDEGIMIEDHLKAMQELARSACPKCIEEYRATVNMLDDLRKEKGKGGQE